MTSPLQQRFPLGILRREVLHESCYFDHLHKPLRFLITQTEDSTVLENYLNEIFDNSWSKNLSCPLSILLKQKMTILATHFFEVCGVVIGNLMKNEGENVLFLELIQVYPEYEKNGLIERQLLFESFKRARDSKIRYVIYNCRNLKSIDMAKKVSQLAFNKNALFLDWNEKNQKFQQFDACDLKTIEEFLNIRPQLPAAYQLKPAKRRCLKRFTPKRLNRELLVEIALPEDEAIFKNYMFNQFMQQTPVNKTLQLNEAETIEHFNVRLSSDQFECGYCIMITDQGRICAAGTCKPIYDLIRSCEKQETKFPVDLTEEVDKIPFSTLKSRQAKAIGDWMTGLVGQFLPEDCDKYMRLEMRTVHPYYTRCGITSAIEEASDQIIIESGFKYFQTLCLAKATAKKVEGKEAHPPVKVRLPYSQFEYKGKQIIQDGIMCDGGRDVTVNFGPIMPINKEEAKRPRAKY